jgi:hypothetical protein
MVINQKTNLEECINVALNQAFGSSKLNDTFTLLNIKRINVDMSEQPIHNSSDSEKEIDVGSCDRPSLLNSMLEGSYTQSETNYGKSNNNNCYQFKPNIYISYCLKTDSEDFNIEHHCAFLNTDMTRIIPLQDNSLLDMEETI